MFNLYMALILFLIGIYGLMMSKDIIKSIVSFNIAEVALILLFLDMAALDGTEVPIFWDGVKNFVDPLPQALMITTIVVGASITALVLMMSIKIFHYFGSLDWDDVLKREL